MAIVVRGRDRPASTPAAPWTLLAALGDGIGWCPDGIANPEGARRPCSATTTTSRWRPCSPSAIPGRPVDPESSAPDRVGRARGPARLRRRRRTALVGLRSGSGARCPGRRSSAAAVNSSSTARPPMRPNPLALTATERHLRLVLDGRVLTSADPRSRERRAPWPRARAPHVRPAGAAPAWSGAIEQDRWTSCEGFCAELVQTHPPRHGAPRRRRGRRGPVIGRVERSSGGPRARVFVTGRSQRPGSERTIDGRHDHARKQGRRPAPAGQGTGSASTAPSTRSRWGQGDSSCCASRPA